MVCKMVWQMITVFLLSSSSQPSSSCPPRCPLSHEFGIRGWLVVVTSSSSVVVVVRRRRLAVVGRRHSRRFTIHLCDSSNPKFLLFRFLLQRCNIGFYWKT